MSRVRWASDALSYLPVIACRSTMQIDAVVALLQGDPVLHRAKPVADVQLAGRLDPREYAWHGRNLPGSMEGSKTVSALDLLHLARTAAEAAAGYLRASSGHRTRAPGPTRAAGTSSPKWIEPPSG